jgi:CheY-like chemotaxis protein
MAKILYVDDEADIRDVAQMSLELDPEFDVRTCSSGRQAVSLAAEWMPDLILLDVMMPEMDGPTTLQALRDQPATADVPVVFITAKSQATEVEGLLRTGAKGVIAKPFDPMALAASVKAHLPQ